MKKLQKALFLNRSILDIVGVYNFISLDIIEFRVLLFMRKDIVG